jgi:NAD-dependent DNA ligase
MLEPENGSSPKPKNKTRKIKVDKIPKKPEEIEQFCIQLLQKKELEKKKDVEIVQSSDQSSSEIPINEIAKSSAVKSPIIKKPRKPRTKKLPKSPNSDERRSPEFPRTPEAKQKERTKTPDKPVILQQPSTETYKEPKKVIQRKPRTKKLPKSPNSDERRSPEFPRTPSAPRPEYFATRDSPKPVEPNVLRSTPEANQKERTKTPEKPAIIQQLPTETHKEPKTVIQRKPKTRKIKKDDVSEISPKKLEKVENVENIEKNINVKQVPKIKRKTSKNMSSPKTTPKKDIEPNVFTINNMSDDVDTRAKHHIQEFKNEGISILEKLSQKDVENMLIVANSNYYNEKGGLMTDNEYDIVKEYVEKKYPANEVVNQIGAPILDNVKNKVTLPYEMWSMDKIKPDTNALSSWMKKYKGPYVLSCKLDGVSGLYSTEGPKPKLYTRGDGKVGQDISFLLEYLNLPKKKGIVVRGEFIIPKKVFQEKYAQQFANPRNLVSGIVNSKKPDSKVNDLHFVAYELIVPNINPSEQLLKLKTDGFEVVQNETYSNISNELLSDTLIDWRTNYQYEIDGVIVTNDAVYSRTSGNPEHAFAFKMMLSDQKAEVKVVDVIWSPSKDGFLKPRVRIEPVRLGGVTIEYATGYNGRFIEDNKIGIGAIIEIIRSGDVIPKIISVTVPAEKAKMPTEEYKWSDTRVDILLENASDNATVQEKKLTLFFTSLEIDGLKAGNVKKLKDAGYDTIPKILKMTKEDFEKVGYKTLAQKYVDTIREKIDNATVIQLMVASGTMGRSLGERKIEPILEAYPDILTSSDSAQTKIAKVKTVKGIENKTATLFVENIPIFIEFLETIGQTNKLSGSPKPTSQKNEIEIDTSHPLYGKRIVMTKVRDQVIIEALKKLGATLDDNIGSKTFVLIVKSMDDVSNKTKYAKDHGIPIMTPDEFKKKYL